MYADADFFLALVKDDDWLQDRAAEIAREYRDDIYTSRATLLELLLISDRFDFDRLEALSYALELAEIEEDESVLFQAADYMDQHGLTAFDAYHVAYAGTDPIIASDTQIGAISDRRIPIEPDSPD